MDALIPTLYSYRAFFSLRMMLLRLLAAILFHLPIVLSFPHSPVHLDLRDGGLATDPPIPSPTTTLHSIPAPLPPMTTSTPIPTTTGNPWKDRCKPGGDCDCTRIKDTNSDEYFQCVTNAACDRCWMNITTTTTPTFFASSTPLPPVTNFLSTDYRTLLPGTYTSSSGGTAHVVIVQQPSQSTSLSVVTSTLTSLVTISVTPLCGASFSNGGSAVVASPFVDLQPRSRWR